MARLIVKLHGQEVANLKLESGQEYIAGRAQDSHIRLNEERGISRQHLKFYERDGMWVCEALSKFLLIQQGTKSVEVLEMSEAAVFSLPPYEFDYDPEVQAEAPAPTEAEAAASTNLPVFVQPRIMPSARPQPEADNRVPLAGEIQGSGMTADTAVRGNSEATVAGVSALVPYMRVSYPNTADDEVLKLEGHLWTAGRERDSEIMIDSPHISRKHFELARTKEGFFVTDLGSSNGTKVNGQRIPPHEPTRLESGDEISIMSIRIVFEIRDNQFANRLDSLPVAAFDPMLAAPPMQWYPQPEAMAMPMIYPTDQEQMPELRDWKKLRPRHLKKVDWKKNKVRVILIAAIPLLLWGLFDKPKPKESPRDPASNNNSVSFQNLKPEQQGAVKDALNLAKTLYMQGKYSLCLTEIAKVHAIIPQFENSKELENFCEQGRELVRRQEDYERKEREKLFIEQQITSYAENCKQKLTPDATVEETRQCMAEAIVLAPEHPIVIEMIHSAQMHEEERKSLDQMKKAEELRRQKGLAHYGKAYKIYKDGRLSASINEFEKFLKTEYPKIGDKKEEARRQIASIKQELKTKVDGLVGQCKQFGEKNKWKDAWTACQKAVDEDPSNTGAKSYRDKVLADLRREMKTIYEDSVLEESLGNVDSAKEKWKRIMQEDIESDDYWQKAKSKIQKYGGGG